MWSCDTEPNNVSNAYGQFEAERWEKFSNRQGENDSMDMFSSGVVVTGNKSCLR